MARTMIMLAAVFIIGCVDRPTVTIPAPKGNTPAIIVADTNQCYYFGLVLHDSLPQQKHAKASFNCYGPDGEFHSHYIVGRVARPRVWRVEQNSSGQIVSAEGESDD